MFVSCGGKEESSPNFADYTLILPAVSIGNVGQLTIDLVVSALLPRHHLIGYLHDASILSVVGNDAFARPGHERGELNLSAEVYKSTEHRLVVIQQRAPIAKGHSANYCQKLIDWIKSCSFKQVVLLSSISATDRVDSQMRSSPLRYLVASSEQLKQTFEQLCWTQLEKKPKFPDITEGTDLVYSLPGGGVTKRFYENCEKQGIPLAVLLTFCSEGDNICDAVNLFLYLNNWLKIVDRTMVESKFAGRPSDFVIPASWSLMFGSPIYQEDPLF